MKQETRDECRHCGRLIEWVEPPMEDREDGRDMRPYWRRKPQWVDVDPPGEDVWNVHCTHEEIEGVDVRQGEHQPKRYCNQKQRNGDPCNAKLIDDMEELYACRKHQKAARYEAKHKADRESQKLQSKWINESYEARIHQLRRMNNIYVYRPTEYVPSYVRENGVMVDTTALLNCLDELRLEIEELKREINGDKD